MDLREKVRNLGKTGLKVSPICLGTMQFGWTADREQAFKILDAYFEAGGNFIDTADVYSRWVEGNPGGVAEEIIGDWVKSRGIRKEVVIATKVRGRMWDGPNGEGLSRYHIRWAVEDSLRRLKTDVIDLYQLHWPDNSTPIEETLRTLDDLIREGKILYIGVSNYRGWMIKEAMLISELKNYEKFVSTQPRYNLVDREEFEKDVLPVVLEYGMGVIPYSPLAAGFLTGKYRRNKELPSSVRASTIQQRYFNDRGFRILEKVIEVAEKLGATPAQVSLAWLLHKPYITSPIIGANSVDQLMDNLRAVEIEIPSDLMEELDNVSIF